jgi:thiol:disulfide interchange protein DsbA
MRHSLLAVAAIAALLALAACGKQPEPTTTEPSAGATTPSTSEPAPSAAPAPTGDLGGTVSATPAVTSVGNWTSGTNYQIVSPAQPTNVAPGKIEVLEMFWYGCNHCYALDPYLENWKKTKPSYIEFVRVPVTWGPLHEQHARMYYVMEALNRPDLHTKIFDLHMEYRNRNQVFGSENEAETRQMQLEFFRKNGVSERAFNDAYDSFDVSRRMNRAKQLVSRYAVDGVPRVIVHGKYITDVSMARGDENLVKLVTDLAAAERG